jgi:hypothetical protein
LGGIADRRRALTTRPTSTAASTSDSQLGRELTRRLVTSDQRVVGRGDDAAQVAQVEMRQLPLGRLGAVEPVGDAK